MRTAITLAKTHDGNWQLLATPDAALLEQRKNFRALRADKAHPDFAQIIYQESDGPCEVLRRITPTQKTKLEEQQIKDRAAAARFDAALKAKATAAARPLVTRGKF